MYQQIAKEIGFLPGNYSERLLKVYIMTGEGMCYG